MEYTPTYLTDGFWGDWLVCEGCGSFVHQDPKYVKRHTEFHDGLYSVAQEASRASMWTAVIA